MENQNRIIKVIKTSGEEESFKPEKIAKVVEAAGLTADQASKLAQEVTDWVLSKNADKIEVGKIRTKVTKLLKEKSPYAAGLYEWYGKVKRKHGN